MTLAEIALGTKRQNSSCTASQKSISIERKRQKKQTSNSSSASDTLEDASDQEESGLEKLLGPSEVVRKPEHSDEAKWLVRMRESSASLVPLVQPRDPVVHRYASEVSESVYTKLKERIKPKNRPRLAKDDSVSDLMTSLQVENNVEVGGDDLLLKLFKQRKYYDTNENEPPVFNDETEMYPCVSELVRFICDAIDDYTKDKDIKPLRRFEVYVHDKNRSKGRHVREWVDMGLVISSNKVTPSFDANPGEPDYWNMLAVIETQPTGSYFHSEENMCEYARNLLGGPTNRRFAWGMGICNGCIGLYIIENDHIIRDSTITFMDGYGGLDFVTLLVFWSFCSVDQLGFDPSVRYNSEDGSWEVDVYDEEKEQIGTLFVDEHISGPSSFIDRRTVCWTCVEDANDIDTDDVHKLIVVKDIWCDASLCFSDSVRDKGEIFFLRKINKMLGHREDLKGMYPELVAAGTVHIKHADMVVDSGEKDGKDCGDSKNSSDSSLVADTTRVTLANLRGRFSYLMRHRVHERIAMKPFAKSICWLNSVDELIVVASDAMMVHTAIYKECDILHNDISRKNIRFTRLPDGSVRGLLIDFDMSIDINEQSVLAQSVGVGTMPCNSISSLIKSGAPRTALNDWESMMYMLSVLGILGMDCDYNISLELKDRELPIGQWLSGPDMSYEQVADVKKKHVHSAEAFKDKVTDYFLHEPGYDHLKKLVTELHRILFDNDRFSVLCRGALDFDDNPDFENVLEMAEKQLESLGSDSDKPGPIDRDKYEYGLAGPLYRRTQYTDVFVQQLNEAMQEAKEQALARIKASLS
ncbi:hypothetical protein IWW45_005684 [Coemansia sp. RSA 485]|nr:hypothetical protein IWW45_005684 [Coemansia sp. RSA 485]